MYFCFELDDDATVSKNEELDDTCTSSTQMTTGDSSVKRTVSSSVLDTNTASRESETVISISYQTSEKPSVMHTALDTSFTRLSGHSLQDKSSITELPQLATTSPHGASNDAEVSLIITQ